MPGRGAIVERGSDGGGGQGRSGGHKDDIISVCGVKVPVRRQKRGCPLEG